MSIKVRYILIPALLASSCLVAKAQAPGSSRTYGGSLATLSIATGGTHTEVSETIYIGPGTYTINGVWNIYSKNIVIDSTARIEGAGSLHIFDAATAGGAGGRSLIDGNNLGDSIEVNIVLSNATGMHIRELPFPAGLVAAGFGNKADNTLYIGKSLNLAVNGADIWLDSVQTGDLRLDSNAAISNYGAQRMVITNNSIRSHVVKDKSADTSAPFVFPVGIADGDYTPATIRGGGPYHVSVQDYTQAMPPVNYADSGMHRTWHVFGGPAASLTLQHNSNTNGTAYTDMEAFITQYRGGSTWSQSSTPNYVSPGIHTSAAVVTARTAGSDSAFLSKKSSTTVPLSLTLTRFRATNVNCDVKIDWQARNEKELLQYQLMHSRDGSAYEVLFKTTPKGGNANYQYLHKMPGEGIHFYRLVMTGSNGEVHYSAIEQEKVICTGEAVRIWTYPNPATGFLMVEGMEPQQLYVLRLLSLDGKVVLDQSFTGAGSAKLDLSNLPTALYVLKVEDVSKKKVANFKIKKM